MTGAIPPDGVCIVGTCHRWRAHDGTHFCVIHMAREG